MTFLIDIYGIIQHQQHRIIEIVGMFRVMQRFTGLGLIALLLLSGGCASNRYSLEQPIVSGNELVNYENDLAACKLAAETANKDTGTDATKTGATLGGIIGALGSAGGDVSNIIVSGVIGATGGALIGDTYEKRVEREQVIACMRELGYNMAD